MGWPKDASLGVNEVAKEARGPLANVREKGQKGPQRPKCLVRGLW
jgi:hypothetical protein